MTHVARDANYQGSLTTPVPCLMFLIFGDEGSSCFILWFVCFMLLSLPSTSFRGLAFYQWSPKEDPGLHLQSQAGLEQFWCVEIQWFQHFQPIFPTFHNRSAWNVCWSATLGDVHRTASTSGWYRALSLQSTAGGCALATCHLEIHFPSEMTEFSDVAR